MGPIIYMWVGMWEGHVGGHGGTSERYGTREREGGESELLITYVLTLQDIHAQCTQTSQ